MNHHATALILGDRGVLVRGRSGAGKTSLAFALIDRCRGAEKFARFVADDQVLLETRNGRVICTAPAAIAGMAEIRGLGPTAVDFEPRMVVDLVVDLVEAKAAPRFPDQQTVALLGCGIPSLVLAERDLSAPVSAIVASLSLP